MNLYRTIKENNEDNLNFVIDSILKKNNITENTKITSINDDKFEKLLGQIKDIFKNKISEKEIKEALSKKLFNKLKEK